MVSVSAESHNSHKIVRNKASNMQLQTDEAEEFSWFLLSASAVKIIPKLVYTCMFLWISPSIFGAIEHVLFY